MGAGPGREFGKTEVNLMIAPVSHVHVRVYRGTNDFLKFNFFESIFKRSPGLLRIALSPQKCSALSVTSSALTSGKQGCIMKTSLYFYETFSGLRNIMANYYVELSVFLG